MTTTHSYHVPGAVLTEREHRVPLDHAGPDGRSISVFTREVADPDGLDRPYLVFLQGGPGFEAARPTSPMTTRKNAPSPSRRNSSPVTGRSAAR